MQSPIVLRSLALACVAIASCASSGKGTSLDRPLPIHLAIIPVLGAVESGDSFLDQLDAERAKDLKLEITGSRFSRELVEALSGALAEDDDGGRRFGMLSLLSPPREDGLRSLTKTQREQYWVNAARDISADYLLDLELEHSRAVAKEINEQFWYEVSLFLFLGPLSYFVDDRSYYVDARLFGNIYDLNALREGPPSAHLGHAGGQGDTDFALKRARDGGSGLDRSALVLPVVSTFHEMQMDFFDRADVTEPQSLLYSALVPPAFLDSESARVQKYVLDETIKGLTSEFASTIRLKQRELYEARRVGGVALDPLHWEVEDLPDDMVRVAGRLWFDQEREQLGEGLANVRSAVYTASLESASGFVEGGPYEEGEEGEEGEQLIEAQLSRTLQEWGPVTAGAEKEYKQIPVEDLLLSRDPKGDAYEFDLTLPVGAETYAVRIEVDVLGNRARQRSFTFVIDEELRTRIEAAKVLPVEDVEEPADQGSLGATASVGD